MLISAKSYLLTSSHYFKQAFTNKYTRYYPRLNILERTIEIFRFNIEIPVFFFFRISNVFLLLYMQCSYIQYAYACVI